MLLSGVSPSTPSAHELGFERQPGEIFAASRLSRTGGAVDRCHLGAAARAAHACRLARRTDRRREALRSSPIRRAASLLRRPAPTSAFVETRRRGAAP